MDNTEIVQPLIDDDQMRHLMNMAVEAERMLKRGESVRTTSTVLGIPPYHGE